MLPYLAIGLLVLIGLLIIARWVASTRPANLALIVRMLITLGAAGFVVYLVVTGRIGLALMLAMALAPVWMRWRALLNRIRGAAGPSQGQSSTIETPYLRMSLDHDSGAMEGTVLRGRRAGARLSELGLAELVALLGECRVDDPDGAGVLEAYLDRAHPDWRAFATASGEGGPSGGGPGSSAAMTREEAYKVLGLEPGADEAAIRAAHRSLMMKLHPDQGGSTYLAAKINQAKDVLLGD